MEGTMQDVNMDKETTEETTENTAILEGVHAEQFRLRIVQNIHSAPQQKTECR